MDDLSAYLLPMEIFFSACTLLGIAGNLLMVIVTIKAKNLQTACHKLIGITCFADVLHQSGQFPFLYGLYTRTQWTTQADCFYVQLVPIFGVLTGCVLLLNLGVDRLIAVTLPAFYRQNQQTHLYFFLHLIAPLVYYFFFLFYAFQFRNDRPAMCAIPEFFDGPSNSLWATVSVILNALVVFCYLLVYVKLRTSSFSNAARAVFKSLFITVAIVSCGWFATMFTNFLSVAFGATGNTMFLIQTYAGIPVNFAAACNFPVYYTISTEHRNAIRSLLFNKKPEKSGEFPTATNNTNNESRRSPSTIVTSFDQRRCSQARKPSVSPAMISIC